MADSDKSRALTQAKLQEWRESAQHMYEQLDTINLEWPALTAEWVRTGGTGDLPNALDAAKLRALVATYTLRAEPEFVREVEIDTNKLKPEQHLLRQWEVPESREAAKAGSASSENEVTHEIQTLKQCPSEPSVFAAMGAAGGKIYLFHTSHPEPLGVLNGHEAAGFGLAWEPASRADKLRLVSGGEDGRLILWEINLQDPEQSLKAEVQTNSIVNDITWDHLGRVIAALENGHVVICYPSFSTVSTGPLLEVVFNLKCHDEGVNSAQLSPFTENLLATGGSDGRVRLWDVRRPKEMLYENFAHEGSINCVRWSPHVDGMLASTATDCVVFLWDIKQIGKEQDADDLEEGAPELLFKHLGHLNGHQVQDLDWHPTKPMLLLTCDGRNVLMAWRPRSEAYEQPVAPPMANFLL